MGRALAFPLLLVGLFGLVSCNDYEMFRLSGYQQESFSNKADILFVVDNSNSMVDEAADLAKNFKQFIDSLESDQTDIQYEGLGDAVDNYKRWVVDRGAFVDFQIGITTTDVAGDVGALKGKVLKRGEKNLAEKFISTLLCEATCFPDAGQIPSDSSHRCGQPFKELSREYLNCECPGLMQNPSQNCSASGAEEGLEATFMAMCRAVPNPPSTCFEPARDPNATQSDTGAPDTDFGDSDTAGDEGIVLLHESDVMTNDGLLRDGATFIPVVVSDDGDSSRREENTIAIPGNYEQIFDVFDTRMSWVAITPPLDPAHEQPPGCTGYHAWSAVRYDYMVRITNGLKIPIMSPGAEGCPTTDFGQALEQFSALLTNLLTVFELQSVPDPDSIIVFVDGDQIDRAEMLEIDKYGLPVYADGWSYMDDANAIRFHGSAIPANEAVVRVYYSPVDGMPRDLPF